MCCSEYLIIAVTDMLVMTMYNSTQGYFVRILLFFRVPPPLRGQVLKMTSLAEGPTYT